VIGKETLDIISRGVAYRTDRSTPPAQLSQFPRDDSELSNIIDGLSFEGVDRIVELGFARESTWGEYTSLVFTYDGKLAWLKSGGFNFDAWRGRNAGYICCAQAIPIHCVCRVSTQCPEHGRKCHGTHD
jgi:hypothetical protein